MKIIYKKGDLLKSDVKIIAHGCNAQGQMGSGVAKQIKAEFPEAYDLYRKSYELNDHTLHLGQVIVARSNEKTILNCITQRFYGNDGNVYVDYDAVRICIKTINSIFPLATVAFPQIGAGLAGGDWYKIEKIIAEESTRFTPVVYIFD